MTEQILKSRPSTIVAEAYTQKFEETTGIAHSDVKLMLQRMQDHLDASTEISDEDRQEIQRFLTENLKKPTLPRRAGAYVSQTTSEPQKHRDVSTITLLAQVQALQARTYSNYWQTLWNQGTVTMQMSLKFAPAIAKATLGAYQEQSKATKADAGKELQSAWIAGISCGVLAGLGGYGAWKAAGQKNAELALSKESADTAIEEADRKVTEAETKLTQLEAKEQNPPDGEDVSDIGKDIEKAKKAKQAAEAEQKAAQAHKELWDAREGKNPHDPASKLTGEEKDKLVAEKEKKFSEEYENAKKLKSGEKMPSVLSNTQRSITGTMKKIGLALSEGCHHAMQSLNMVQMPMTCANAASATQFDSEKSVHQALEGQCHALKSMGENFKANYDQNYQRSEDLRGSVQQFFDGTVIQTYKSAIETFAQTLIAMARA